MIQYWLTARGQAGGLVLQAPPEAAAARPGDITVRVDPSRRYQIIEGFGGAFTEAAAVTWRRLGTAAREAALRDYFDRDDGHGYTLCRVHLGSCDFALGNYAHVDRPGDTALAGFTIERDREALLPFILEARRVAGRPIKLLASPWSPPAWMKSSQRMNAGGRLLPEFRAAWARCYCRFIEAYEAAGVPIWGVTVQNEPEAEVPWDSCLYSAEEERDFVRDFLGPELAATGLGHVRILVHDHNRDRMVERARTVLDDPLATRYVWGTAFHWYGPERFDAVEALHEAFPDKHLLFTEGCQEGGPHHGSWDVAERYGRALINDLKRWTVGWIDWNLLLDHEGGPNHVGNLCSAPLMADAEGLSFERQPSYYALGHVARHVAPGARRIHVESREDAPLAVAFENPDGTLAFVMMNAGDAPVALALTFPRASLRVTLPGRSIATIRA